MRVSVRLKQSLWASALMVSTVVIQSPSSALSQTQFPVQDSGAVQAIQRIPAETDKAKLADARGALLKARQALAKSDVATA
eukprot:COSAG01_NODE_31231_length_601_cov_1.019920_1_plen_80_part_10